MTIITIKKKFKLEYCPFCGGTQLEDVSNLEYPCMFECSCGKVTAVEFDGDVLKKDCVYLNRKGFCWSKRGKPDCEKCGDYRVEE